MVDWWRLGSLGLKARTQARVSKVLGLRGKDNNAVLHMLLCSGPVVVMVVGVETMRYKTRAYGEAAEAQEGGGCSAVQPQQKSLRRGGLADSRAALCV